MENEDIRDKYEKLAEFLNENGVKASFDDDGGIDYLYFEDESPFYVTAPGGWEVQDNPVAMRFQTG